MIFRMKTPAREPWFAMTDMQEMPPDAEEDPSTAQTSPQPIGPIQSTDAASDADSSIQSAFKTAGIRGLLPTALAKEERAARLNESRTKRRSGIELTADEIRDDLEKILSHLITQLSTHTAGVSIILKMPAQALLYTERTATYAIGDYPRSFENDVTITGLWDALERIYMAAADWRKDPNKGDGRAVLASIDRMAKAAVRPLPLDASDEASPETDASDKPEA